MNILVVDDNESILRIVSRMLRASGHRIIALTSSTNALSVIEHENIDLLLSDVSMPILTGTELVSAARRLKPDLPVVYMSASDHPDGSSVVIKPFRMQDLLDGIHRATACTP
jgi:CheY-like chemotaxis protein